MKKAQGLSMTTIVVAALALLVLVVLVLIFTGRLNLWGQGMDEAQGCINFCKGLNKHANTELTTSDSDKAKCKTLGGETGTVVPGAKGSGDDTICCCYKSLGEGLVP